MELTKQIIILVASILFTWLVAKYPNFPLDKAQFINFVLWVAGLFGVVNGARIGLFRTSIELQGYNFKNQFLQN